MKSIINKVVNQEIQRLKEKGFLNEDNENEIRDSLETVSYEGYSLGFADGEEVRAEPSHFTAYGKKEDYL